MIVNNSNSTPHLLKLYNLGTPRSTGSQKVDNLYRLQTLTVIRGGKFNYPTPRRMIVNNIFFRECDNFNLIYVVAEIID
jgi:hypothetical protein